MRTIDQKKFGLFISRRRQLLCMTQKDIAEKIGVSYQAVSKWECGLSLPDIEIWPNLADLLDVRIEELIEGNMMVGRDMQAMQLADAVEKTVATSMNEVKRHRRMTMISAFLAFVISVTAITYCMMTAIFYHKVSLASFRFAGAEGRGTSSWHIDNTDGIDWQCAEDDAFICNGEVLHFIANDERMGFLKVSCTVKVLDLLENRLLIDDIILDGAIMAYGRQDQRDGVSLYVVMKEDDEINTYKVMEYDHLFVNRQGKYVMMLGMSADGEAVLLGVEPRTIYRNLDERRLSKMMSSLSCAGYSNLKSLGWRMAG